MVNINLKTQVSEKSEKIEIGKFLTFSIIVLILVLVFYGGVVFYSSRLDNNIILAREDYNQRLNEFKSGNARNVLDFQNRLDQSSKMIDKSVNSRDNIQEIEKLLIPSIFLESYEFEATNKTVNLLCVATNYDEIAKQILSFKKSDYFSSVVAGESVFTGENGKIKFEVKLFIK